MREAPKAGPPRVRTVLLSDIDFKNETFRVRSEQGSKRVVGSVAGKRELPAVGPPFSYPLLWRDERPYTVLRGFQFLAAARRSGGADHGGQGSVEAAFLQRADEPPSIVAAMVAASVGDDGRFSLTMLECADAIRRLTALGASKRDVSEFLQKIAAPPRTATRAKHFSDLCPEVWDALQNRSISAAHAEVLDRFLGGVKRPEAGSLRGSPETKEVLAQVIATIQEHQMSTAEMLCFLGAERSKQDPTGSAAPHDARRRDETPFWKLLVRKRIRVYRKNFGPGDTPADLLLAAKQYAKLADLLTSRATRYFHPS
jgi:hypothetical protein